MPDTVIEPYIERHPHDLISANDWNQIQVLIKQDILAQIAKALEALQSVPRSGDSIKLGGKTPEELSRDIVNSMIQEMNKRTGYMRAFRLLKPDEPSMIRHGLKDFPLVDLYGLTKFEVVCSEDDEKSRIKVYFYLQHSSESSLSYRASPTDPVTQVPVDPKLRPPSRLPFAKMLELYKVGFDDSSSLGDVEAEFWAAFLAGTGFDDSHACHSPWWDRCCRESKPVAELKRKHDWDNLCLQMRPIKIVDVLENAPDVVVPASLLDPSEDVPVGTLEVRQHDFDQFSVTLRVPALSPTNTTVLPFPLMALLKV